MSLVFAGACSHAPGITGRAERADPQLREAFYTQFRRLGDEIRQAQADALVIIGAEHFANFFMDNMPAICVGMAHHYDSPIEDEKWLGIQRTRVPGAPDLAGRLIERIMQRSDVAYAQEWKFDHGVAVPLHFLTPDYDLPVIPVNINCQGPPLIPLHRAFAFGQGLRKAIDAVPERIAVVCTGGISHWPATPDSGKINEPWDRAFLARFLGGKTDEMLAYTDAQTYQDAGQGGFEIRTFIALSGVCDGAGGDLWFYAPIPIFAVGCTVARMHVGSTVTG